MFPAILRFNAIRESTAVTRPPDEVRQPAAVTMTDYSLRHPKLTEMGQTDANWRLRIGAEVRFASVGLCKVILVRRQLPGDARPGTFARVWKLLRGDVTSAPSQTEFRCQREDASCAEKRPTIRISVVRLTACPNVEDRIDNPSPTNRLASTSTQLWQQLPNHLPLSVRQTTGIMCHAFHAAAPSFGWS